MYTSHFFLCVLIAVLRTLFHPDCCLCLLLCLCAVIFLIHFSILKFVLNVYFFVVCCCWFLFCFVYFLYFLLFSFYFIIFYLSLWFFVLFLPLSRCCLKIQEWLYRFAISIQFIFISFPVYVAPTEQ